MHLVKLTETVVLPQGVTVQVNGPAVTVKGPKGENTRSLATKSISIKVEGGKAIVSAENVTKNIKCSLETAKAHLKNMVRGVAEGHVYRLKICSGHFPMSVSAKGDKFEVKNFIGESVPRTLKINPATKVTIAGTEITVESSSKEAAGTQAAAIELLTRRPGFDTRVFQDGIYIVEKDGKKV
jgi:large subunit ribosomal protein L6